MYFVFESALLNPELLCVYLLIRDIFQFNNDIALSDMATCAESFVQNSSTPRFLKDPQPLYLRGADGSQPKKPYRTLETSTA